MPLDAQAIGRGCAGRITQADQLCGLELDRFKAALADGAPITVACTQEAPLFREVAEDFPQAQLTFVNIRETGGWSNDAARAGPKAAALIAAAAEEMPPISLVTLESNGVVLIYGRDEIAIEAGRRLADRLDITVLLTKPGDVVPRRSNEFPVLKGTIRNARGHLGAFELAIDDYALPSPSSRAKLVFGPSRNGATSTCDLILDLSGGMPLFPAHELRPGYLRADPRDRAAVERAIAEAGGLVGTFDKPRFIRFSGVALRAFAIFHHRMHALPRSVPDRRDHAERQCGRHRRECLRGLRGVRFRLPDRRGLLFAAERGCADAAVAHAAADLSQGRRRRRHRAVPRWRAWRGHHRRAGAVRRGTSGERAAASRQRSDAARTGDHRRGFCLWRQWCCDRDARQAEARYCRASPRGRDVGHHHFIARLWRRPGADHRDRRSRPVARHAGCGAHWRRDAKAGRLRSARRQTRRARDHVPRTPPRRAPPVDVVPLAPGAPFGGVNLNVDGCTLCHACVTACPTHALSDNPDRAMLRFTESLCVQCGLCEATCPEKVITIEPRLDFKAWNAPLRVLKEEEPFLCIACGKPFGTKSSIDRVLAKLGDNHWMFQGANAKRLDVIKMCADCRVEAVVNESFDPHAAPQRPPVMTTEDYLRARDTKKGDPLGS